MIRPSVGLLSGLFVLAGVLHFVITDVYAEIVPPVLPAPRLLVHLSGIAEILGGLGLLMRRTRRWAGIGLLLLLAAVWPANFQMLAAAYAEGASTMEKLILWLRLPLQIPLAWWVWRVAVRKNRP